jgi:hypothetical protein
MGANFAQLSRFINALNGKRSKLWLTGAARNVCHNLRIVTGVQGRAPMSQIECITTRQ